MGDLLTPVAAFMKLRHERKGSAFLLESVEGGAVRGRFSMIGLDPDLVWRCQDGVAVDRPPGAEPHAGIQGREALPPLDSLRALIEESALPLSDDLPPMAAGLFGYLGYDMVRQMERLPEPNPDVLEVPDAILDPPDRDGGVRCGEGRDLAHHAGAPASRASRPRPPMRRRSRASTR